MLVYGDARRLEDPREKAEAIRKDVERWRIAALPIERHALLTEVLVEAGELEQGLLDARLACKEAASRLTRTVAKLLLSSFRALGDSKDEPAEIESALEGLLASQLPETIEISTPEGYAFYGLYPETYFVAAEGTLQDGALVIGIRSIGTGLAAVVGAVAGGRSIVLSVRPQGHPFDRRLAPSAPLETAILNGTPEIAIVDEGPGLSGSSFGCVADWLEDRGVPPESIAFFPSHRGTPGPYASPRHQERWQRARRYVAEFEDVFTSPEARWPLASWVADLTGEAEGPLEDLSAGRWREKLIPDCALWPPADVQGERRKYRLQAGGRSWLLKFAGLGRYGREKLTLAQKLEGLIPSIAGLRHGFLVGPWLEEARPLPLVPSIDRPALLDAVASYLARRARLPADPRDRGATPERLFEMMSYNTGKALGPEAAEALSDWKGRLPEIARREHLVLTDNKPHAWEWLVLPNGKILKADALDHHRTNDLVGPQDLAWDLAGTAVELSFDEGELDDLASEVARRSGTPPAERLQLDFYTLAYLAFQTGRHNLAAEALASSAPEEAVKMHAAAEGYAERLRLV
ncbi:MAG TPA: hypothetical protein VGQ28_01825 [Thermoanaerobaculia bacterium]|nr:hypothetical protein [Thermoanaerobaculia bacterium]